MGPAIVLAAVQQLVLEHAVTAAMCDHILELDQTREMDFQLRIAPAITQRPRPIG